MADKCSTKPLIAKLGIKPGCKLAFVHAPDEYAETLGPLPEDAVVRSKLQGLDFIQAFYRTRKELEAEFPKLKKGLVPSGALWISWPKKAAKVKTNLDENVVREIGLGLGLVETKVCAVDAVWSGLKFVYRLKDRK
jgi:hypothetical protein